jgi:hypothetical protein
MKQTNDQVPIALSQLLRIDVSAEQRKLGRHTLQGPWQLPSELVRMRFSSGVRHVSIRFKRRGFELSDSGSPLDAATLAALQLLSDPGAQDEERHEALLELERREYRALISLATLRNVRFEMPIDTADGFVLRVSSPELDNRAQRFTRFALRFAALTDRSVTIDGTNHGDSLENLLVSRRLRDPLVGAIGLPAVGRDGQLWLLQHGVLSTHQSFSKAPAFHCVLEIAGNASAAALRSTAEQMLPRLAEQFQTMLLSVAARDDLPEIVRQALATSLLEIARDALPTIKSEICALPLFRRIDVEGKTIHRRSVSLGALIDEANRQDGRITAIDIGSPPPRTVEGGVSMLVLGRAERALLVEAFALQFVPPTTPSRESPFSFRWRDGLTKLAAWIGSRVTRSTPIAPDTLTQDEIQFLEGLSRILGTSAAELSLHEGSGTVRLRADQTRQRLIATAHLPKEHVLLRESIARMTRDGDHWRYPVALALSRGRIHRGGRSAKARGDWHQAAGAKLDVPDSKEH